MERYATLRPLAGRKKGDLEEMFRCIAERLGASGERGCVRFRILDGERHAQWHLDLEGETSRVHQEPVERPDLEIVTCQDTWRKIAEGKLSPLVAFAKRKLRVRGDENLGKRLLERLSAGDGKTEICR